jgi:DNA (cytosine-5)-methyltransferase 1
VGAIDEDGSAVDVYAQNHGTDPDRAIKGQVSALVDFAVRGIAEDARWSNQPEMIDDRWATLTDTDAVDVLLAGPPCQGHSNLNNHTRRNDRRNEDYLYVPAVACALDIPVVIIENVPAVIHDHGSVVDTAKQLFLEAGYRVETGVFKAGAMGWAQNRSRFFLIACKHTSPAYLHHVAEALALPKGRPPLSVMWAIGDFEDADPDEHHMYRQAAYTQDNLARIAYLHDEDVFDLPVELHNEKHREGTSYTSVYGRMYGDRPAGTITTGFLTPGRGRYVHPTRRRTLNPREAARLQGFPDTYRFLLDGKPPPSGQLTKWIGDAVPMPLGYAAAISALSAGLPQR